MSCPENATKCDSGSLLAMNRTIIDAELPFGSGNSRMLLWIMNGGSGIQSVLAITLPRSRAVCMAFCYGAERAFDFALHLSYMARLSNASSKAIPRAGDGSGRKRWAYHLTQKAAGHGFRSTDRCALCGLFPFGGAIPARGRISAGFPAIS